MKENTILERQYSGLRSVRSAVPPWWKGSEAPSRVKPLEIQAETVDEADKTESLGGSSHVGVEQLDPTTIAIDPTKIEICDPDDFPRFPDDDDPKRLHGATTSLAIFTCRRCGSHRYRDVAIHGNRSIRRDCGECGLTDGFPVWKPHA